MLEQWETVIFSYAYLGYTLFWEHLQAYIFWSTLSVNHPNSSTAIISFLRTGSATATNVQCSKTTKAANGIQILIRKQLLQATLDTTFKYFYHNITFDSV